MEWVLIGIMVVAFAASIAGVIAATRHIVAGKRSPRWALVLLIVGYLVAMGIVLAINLHNLWD